MQHRRISVELQYTDVDVICCKCAQIEMDIWMEMRIEKCIILKNHQEKDTKRAEHHFQCMAFSIKTGNTPSNNI